MLEPEAEGRRPLLTFIVVGGGPTGVEMAGALSELIRLGLVKDYPRLDIKDVRILLLEATDKLLASMPERLREAAGKTLWRKGIDVRFGATVADVDGERIRLKGGDGGAEHRGQAAGQADAAIPLPRSGHTGDDRPERGCRPCLRTQSQRLPRLGHVAGRAHHPADRFSQQVVRATQLGVGLLLL